ncbi:MAG: NrdH-redoxin [Candidatus Lloydbacteria bacterium RIFCSPHIGHO2_01_FULL_49_22]|uniref:NrdH-redoxin n=1 Tax=Candidatus Lloydbacteria bacterium RIFCSPHIGHO2_01_FULL_49_22 TaxID=1798658 RepID=A0A1G2CTV0_9BACT|nr:MAG: NrdH-redoxin [Candidatus Lloydbacteria bacterium RIFCSPHIGHO2_01_FULL_49_22]OGZ09670.1 MAG: NrdH-redoxin [Candidatus Lloydbacteria bacterium RIFCSPHIGHO2_02_FULL_50_18]
MPMKSVQIYSTESCGYCKLAKEFFQKNNVEFQEFDVGKDLAKRQEMIEKSGQMGVPVIIIDKDIIVGFNKSKLQELLGIVPA